jgi:hypothetical protein
MASTLVNAEKCFNFIQFTARRESDLFIILGPKRESVKGETHYCSNRLPEIAAVVPRPVRHVTRGRPSDAAPLLPAGFVNLLKFVALVPNRERSISLSGQFDVLSGVLLVDIRNE